MDAIVFRAARGDEADLLTEVALRSKGHWGYDQEFLDACRAELTFRPEDVVTRRIVVADSSSEIVGFYSLDGDPPSGELGNLWILPERIGTRLGRRLWHHAVASATEAGFTVKSRLGDGLDFRLAVHLLGVICHDDLETSIQSLLVKLKILGAAPSGDVNNMLDVV